MPAKPPHLGLRVFLASPGDFADERKIARELMDNALPQRPDQGVLSASLRWSSLGNSGNL